MVAATRTNLSATTGEGFLVVFVRLAIRALKSPPENPYSLYISSTRWLATAYIVSYIRPCSVLVHVCMSQQRRRVVRCSTHALDGCRIGEGVWIGGGREGLGIHSGQRQQFGVIVRTVWVGCWLHSMPPCLDLAVAIDCEAGRWGLLSAFRSTSVISRLLPIRMCLLHNSTGRFLCTFYEQWAPFAQDTVHRLSPTSGCAFSFLLAASLHPLVSRAAPLIWHHVCRIYEQAGPGRMQRCCEAEA